MSVGPTKLTARQHQDEAARLKQQAARTLDPKRRQQLLALALYNRREADKLQFPH